MIIVIIVIIVLIVLIEMLLSLKVYEGSWLAVLGRTRETP